MLSAAATMPQAPMMPTRALQRRQQRAAMQYAPAASALFIMNTAAAVSQRRFAGGAEGARGAERRHARGRAPRLLINRPRRRAAV